jgi:hypothetical protein
MDRCKSRNAGCPQQSISSSLIVLADRQNGLFLLIVADDEQNPPTTSRISNHISINWLQHDQWSRKRHQRRRA